MILARTNSNSIVFGSVQTAGAIGGVVGGLAMSAWGGPKKKVHGVLAGWAASGLLGLFLIGLGRSFPLWAVGSFFATFFIPLVNSSNQAIWQSKVAPDLQGRVFAIRRLIAWFVNPLATLIAGPLADFALEPAMRQGGALTGTFGWLSGIGPGAGMALIIMFAGIAAMFVGLGGYTVPVVRQAEDLLPDHDAVPEAEVDLQARLEELLETRRRLITDPHLPDRERALKEVDLALRDLEKQRSQAD